MQTHKFSMAIETMVCVLRTVCKLRLLRDNFRSVYEPPRDPCLGKCDAIADRMAVPKCFYFEKPDET